VGLFNHLNFQIDPPILDSVELLVTLELDVDGGPTISPSFLFLVDHTETPNLNNPDDCQFPGKGISAGVKLDQ